MVLEGFKCACGWVEGWYDLHVKNILLATVLICEWTKRRQEQEQGKQAQHNMWCLEVYTAKIIRKRKITTEFAMPNMGLEVEGFCLLQVDWAQISGSFPIEPSSLQTVCCKEEGSLFSNKSGCVQISVLSYHLSHLSFLLCEIKLMGSPLRRAVGIRWDSTGGSTWEMLVSLFTESGTSCGGSARNNFLFSASKTRRGCI